MHKARPLSEKPLVTPAVTPAPQQKTKKVFDDEGWHTVTAGKQSKGVVAQRGSSQANASKLQPARPPVAPVRPLAANERWAAARPAGGRLATAAQNRAPAPIAPRPSTSLAAVHARSEHFTDTAPPQTPQMPPMPELLILSPVALQACRQADDLVRCGRYIEAQHTLRAALTKQPNDIGLHEALLKLLGDLRPMARIPARLAQHMASMRAADVGFRLNTFHIVIDAYKRAGLATEAWDLFEAMLAANVTPDTFFFTSFITANGLAKRPEDALNAFKMMQTFNIQGDVRTYTALIMALSAAGRYQDAWRAYLDMKEAHVPPDDYAIYALANCFDRTNRCAEGAKLLSQEALPVTSLPMLAELHLKIGQVGEAKRLCDVALAKCPPGSYAHEHAAICALEIAGRQDPARFAVLQRGFVIRRASRLYSRYLCIQATYGAGTRTQTERKSLLMQLGTAVGRGNIGVASTRDISAAVTLLWRECKLVSESTAEGQHAEDMAVYA